MDAPRPFTNAGLHVVYDDPPARLVRVPDDARQVSPLVPGADVLEALPESALASMTMLASPGTLDRRYTLALMLRALAPDAPFTVLAPNDKGGTRLSGELSLFGCAVEETSKAHHRICQGNRPRVLDDGEMQQALAGGAPRKVEDLGLWSQPGIFSWNRIDAGTVFLADALPPLKGRGADLGAGIGVLAHSVLASPAVTQLDLIDIDRRAIDAARRNVDDPRARFGWADVRAGTRITERDFIVMNPPFHAGGHEDKALGQIFIRRAAESLRTGGCLWLVANRHLPYEATLKPLFRRVTPHAETHAFKIIEALK